MHLTKRVVDALEPGDEHLIFWDDEVSGLGVRVTKTGVEAFVVDCTTRVGRRRRLTIGRYGVLTVDQARAEAKKVLGSVVGGADPLEDKRVSRFQSLPTRDQVQGEQERDLPHRMPDEQNPHSCLVKA